MAVVKGILMLVEKFSESPSGRFRVLRLQSKVGYPYFIVFDHGVKLILSQPISLRVSTN